MVNYKPERFKILYTGLLINNETFDSDKEIFDHSSQKRKNI